MEEYVLEGVIREKSRTRYSRSLRREGKIPGVIYGRKKDPIMVAFEEKELSHLVSQETAVITVRLDKDSLQGIIRDVQYHPVNDRILHIDIQSVDITQTIRVSVPIVLEGSPASIKLGGILEHITREVEIECLPLDIPEHISLDISQLEIGESVHVEDIKLEKGKILSRQDQVIAAVVPPIVEKEAVPDEEAELEAAAEETSDETEEEQEKDKKKDQD